MRDRPAHPVSPVDAVQLRRLHASAPEAVAPPVTLDDASWRDLDGDALLQRLAGRCSELGQLILYGWLRAPQVSSEGLAQVVRRRALAERLRRSAEWTALSLAELPRLPTLLLETLAGRDRLPALGWAPLALTVVALLSPLLFHLSLQLGVLGVGTALIANQLYRVWATPRIGAATASLEFLAALLHRAQRLLEAGLPAGAERDRLQAVVQRLRPLRRRLRGLQFAPVFDDFPGEYVRLLLLSDERRLARAAALIDARRDDVAELLATVGAIEASAAVARLGGEVDLRPPALSHGARTLEVRGVRHPLLAPEAVPNDLSVEGGWVITGSNMSGKSTFLRAVGLNAVLAQSLGWVCAEVWSGPPVRIATALRNDDQLLEGESYYFAEAVRLRTLLERSDVAPAPLLVAIDEPFRGTNSAERIGAGAAVIRALRRNGARVLVATHDRELGRLLATELSLGHFTDHCTEEGLRFDYLLRPGPATSRNAIHLLGALGYPGPVVEEARALAASLTV